LKYGDALNVDFYTEGIDNQQTIAPLLLINFIENSFKHGDADSNPEAFVHVNLMVEDGVLEFSVENSFQPRNVGEVHPDSYRDADVHEIEGFGLKNAQRLLDLAYPNRYELAQKAENGIYGVQLKLALG
jgi:sensor histidine kinase YesM